MKKFYWKNEKIIKICFSLFVIIIVLIFPLFFLINSEEYENTKEIPEPTIEANLREANNHYEESGEFFSDWYLTFDTAKFNDWNVDEYYVLLSKESYIFPSFNLDDFDQQILWTSEIDSKKIENSLIYKTIIESQFSNVAPTTDENNEIISIIENATLFDNSGSTPIISGMSESNGEWKIFASAKFSIEANGITQKFTINWDETNTLKISVTPGETYENYKITLNDPKILEYHENTTVLGKVNKMFDIFFYDGTVSRVDNLKNTISPKIFISNVYNDLNVYKEIPNIDINIYASENDDSIVNLNQDKLIYSATNVFVKANNLNSITFSEKYIGNDGKSAEDWIYDEDNYLIYPHIKITGNLSWEFKTDDEIETFYKNNHPEIENVNIDSTSLSSRSGSIEFGNNENCAKAKDEIVFSKIMEYDKSVFPNFVIYPNWKNGIFNIYFATTDKYVFAKNYTTKKIDIVFYFTLIDDDTGEEKKFNVPLGDIELYSSPEFGNIYYTNVIPTLNINENNQYFITNEVRFVEFRTYGENFKYDTYTGEKSRSISINDFIFSHEITDFENENQLLLLPDNIITFNNIKNNYDSNVTILIIVISTIILFVIPLILIIILKILKSNPKWLQKIKWKKGKN